MSDDTAATRLPLRPAPFWPAVALAAVFAAAHLPFLPLSLEDIDSVNFALGLRHFDPALHQPHPPGYPVYIALGHLSLALVGWMAPAFAQVRAEAVALAAWSIAGGALAIVAAALFSRALEAAFPDEASRLPRWVGLSAASLLALAPLFSISGLRPLSDMPGLALALLAQALILRGWARGGMPLVAGAAIAGVAVGIRVQTAALTGPLLLAALVVQRGPRVWPLRVAAVAAGAAGTLIWAVPLFALTGGIAGYVRALGSQAGEDFAWVDMVWTNPTPRLLALALYRTLVLSWGDPRLGILVTLLAAAGFVVAAMRLRRTLAVLCIAFVPYAAFHIVLQETVTIRYALPVVVPVVWLAALAIAQPRRLSVALWAAVAVPAFLVSVPTAIDYGQQEHPAFRAIADMVSEGEGAPAPALFSHHSVYRSIQAAAPAWLNPVPSERQREWLGPIRYFREGGRETVWFLADPVRTDLALFDPASVETSEPNPWRAYAHPEMGGARPTGALWQRLRPPGWMAGDGWSLTPETGGRVRAAGTGVDHRPIEAWIARRAEPVTFYVGGFHLGVAADAPAELTVSIDGRVVDRWTVDGSSAGRPFLRFVTLADGVPGEPGSYATLSIAARPIDGGRPAPEMAIRQFDLQSAGGRPLLAFGDGWYEDEYAPDTGLRWRWSGARSDLHLVASRTAVVRVRGESPVKYVGAPPTVRVTAGGLTLATFQPATDFDWRIVVPADALKASKGVVTIETDRTYLPGQAEGSADPRRLGLRVYEVHADLQ